MRNAPAVLLILLLALAPAQALAAERAPVLVLDVRQADQADHLRAVSLQGVVNRIPEAARVFLVTRDQDLEWLQYCLRIMPREIKHVGPDELLDLTRPYVKGQVLYDPAVPYTVDIATTTAGLRDAVVSEVDLGLPTVLDLRGRWRSAAQAWEWAVGSLLPECDQSSAAVLPSDCVAMRDFAIARRMFVVSAPVAPEEESFQAVLFRLSPGTALFGDVDAAVLPELGANSHFLIRAAQAANLSFLSTVEPGRYFRQYLRYMEPTAPRYLSLIFDCSDLDFAVNETLWLWESAGRGARALGWAIPGGLAEAAPPVAHRYYADAYWSGVDQFVLGPSGAGQMDVGMARALHVFYRATADAAASLDMGGVLLASEGIPPEQLGDQVARYASETGVRGVFVTGIGDLAPALYQGIPTLAAPRVRSAQEAVTYLDRIPLDRRCAALVLDANALTPADAGHIAAHVADRFVLVPPGDMIEVMREMSLPAPGEAAAVAVASVDYTEAPQPAAPISVRAVVGPREQVMSVSVIYQPANRASVFSEPMSLTSTGDYAAEVPPFLQGGSLSLRVRARDQAGRVAWSPAWTLQVPFADTDSDGLADAEEAYLLSDSQVTDTDGDGLADASDHRPLGYDQSPCTYLGIVEPPSDLPYLRDPGRSRADDAGRHLGPGESCLYWLPTALAPPGAPFVVSLDASGAAALTIGVDANHPAQQFEGRLSGLWYSDPLPASAEAGGVFFEISCPVAADEPLTIRGLSVMSPPGAPSVADLSLLPAHPGPDQPIFVSALIFSPRGVSEARLVYRVNGGGTVSAPMAQIPDSQRYHGRIPALENRDELEFWVSATDSDGNHMETVPCYVPVGGRSREVISLLARRDFLGEWASSPDWDGAGRVAAEAGLRDSAYIRLAGGAYNIWALAGGRGQGIDVYLKDQKIGGIDLGLPDGWQRVGRLVLDDGRHKVSLVSQAVADAPPQAAPRYAAVVFSADPSFKPPAGRVFDVHNSIALLSPQPEATLSGNVELKATGAGNITAAGFSLDGELLRQVSGPPFRLALNAERLPPGEHLLRVEAVDRVGPTGLAVEVPVTVAH